MFSDKLVCVGLPRLRRYLVQSLPAAVIHTPTGLCNPVAKLQTLHANPKCHSPAVDAATGSIPEIWNHFDFQPVPKLD